MDSDGGGLRQRRSVRQEDEPEPASMGDFLVKRIKKLDIHPKVEEEYQVKTQSGAAVSIVTGLVIAVLLVNELSAFMTIGRTQHVEVDTHIAETLLVNFNITFPALKCGVVMVDVMDVVGEQQVNINRQIHKLRRDKDGEPIGDSYIDLHEVNANEMMAFNLLSMINPKLLPRPKVQVHVKKEEDKQKAVGKADDHDHEGEHEETEDISLDGEGCTVWGSLTVNKVAGNFHIALGASNKHGGKHVHHFMLSEARKYNSSHIIHHLSFGKKAPGIPNPLDGVKRILDDATGHFQYFLKVVPTTYEYINGSALRTSQFSVTEQMKKVTMQMGQGKQKIPGVFFIYDISPFSVTVTETREPLSEFLVSICAVLGGIFTIAGLADSCIHHSTMLHGKAVKLGVVQ